MDALDRLKALWNQMKTVYDRMHEDKKISREYRKAVDSFYKTEYKDFKGTNFKKPSGLVKMETAQRNFLCGNSKNTRIQPEIEKKL